LTRQQILCARYPCSQPNYMLSRRRTTEKTFEQNPCACWARCWQSKLVLIIKKNFFLIFHEHHPFFFFFVLC
jgi:hypothetical protein